MADERPDPAANAPDEAALAVAARHALHEEELVVALAAGTLDADEDVADIERARGLVERCAACQALHADVASIGAAIRADARGAVSSPRDFRLSADDARRLGGFVRVDGFLTRLRRSVTSFARPLGASMATLGIVGVLVGSMSFVGGAATGAAAPQAGNLEQQTTAPGSEDSSYLGPKSTYRMSAMESASRPSIGVENQATRDSLLAAAPAPGVLLVGGSVALLVAGLLLLAIGFRRREPRGIRS